MDEVFILYPVAGPDDVFVERYAAPDPVERGYSAGEPMPAQEPVRLYYQGKERHKTDLVAGIHLFPVISSHFKDVITGAHVSHVDFSPAQLICTRPRRVDNSYWFLNILDNIAALDWEQSRYELFPGTRDLVTSIERLVIHDDALRGRDLVRLAEMRSIILVSLRLRERIEAAGLSGIGFQQLGDFSSYQ